MKTYDFMSYYTILFGLESKVNLYWPHTAMIGITKLIDFWPLE